MAEPGSNSFENLTHSGLISAKAKDDKNVSMNLDVYMGHASLVVFTGGGGKPWKTTLPAKMLAMFKILLERMRDDPRPQRQPMFISKFEQVDGKWKSQQIGCVGVGIDDNLGLYIDVSAQDLQGRHQFYIKPDSKFDFSQTTLTEKDTLIGMIQYLLDAFGSALVFAQRLSSFKRAPGGGGGSFGNKGGGGGNRNYGNNGGGGTFGGGGNNRQQSYGGGPDSDNDLHV